MPKESRLTKKELTPEDYISTTLLFLSVFLEVQFQKRTNSTRKMAPHQNY